VGIQTDFEPSTLEQKIKKSIEQVSYNNILYFSSGSIVQIYEGNTQV